LEAARNDIEIVSAMVRSLRHSMTKSKLRRTSYDGVVVTTPVTIPYVRHSIESAHWWIARALRALVDTSGISARDFDGFCLSSFTVGPDTAIGLTQHFGLSVRWLDHIPLGGVSAIAALRRAARAVQAGDCDVAACVAGDTNHVDSFRRTQEGFSRFSQDAVYPYGAGGANASFAMIARHYMKHFGVKREDLGRIAVSQRANALHNPNALMKAPLTLEQYMSARPIADPIHLYDCVMPCAGAEAFLVMREETAAACNLRGTRILASIERHNARIDDVVQNHGGWVADIDDLYSMAEVRPDQIDFVQTYDDYPVIVMMQLEDLGFCKKGEGVDFIRQHDLTINGTFPHNTSGGQLSVGQAGAAGAYLGVTEAVRQVLGEAGPTQVKSARVGLASGFGMINYDRGLSSGAAIFAGTG
jgi:acetyl-CoA acetyltransferase